MLLGRNVIRLAGHHTWLAGLQTWLDGTEGQMDIRMDKQMNGESSHSTGPCPLPGPLPIKQYEEVV